MLGWLETFIIVGGSGLLGLAFLVLCEWLRPSPLETFDHER